MLDESTIADDIPDLPLVRCSNCGRGMFRAAVVGVISMNCLRCKGTTIYVDGEPILAHRKGMEVRRAIGVAHSAKITDLVAMMEARWVEMKKAKATERGSVAVGLRFDVFMRDNFACCYCGRKATDGAVLEMDHVVPRSDGGRDEMRNLVTACWECNRGKSAKSVEGRFNRG